MRHFKILLLLLLTISCFMVDAQTKYKFGAGGGVNFSNFYGSDVNRTNKVTGFNVGLINEIKFPIIFGIEADILLSKKGADGIIFKDEQGNSIGTSNIKISYIDIPIVLKIYTLKVISFHIGAQYSFLLSAKMNVMDGLDVKDQFNSGDIAAVLGFGIDVSRFHFSTRYNFGLLSIDNGGADIKNNMLTLSLGFWLKK